MSASELGWTWLTNVAGGKIIKAMGDVTKWLKGIKMKKLICPCCRREMETADAIRKTASIGQSGIPKQCNKCFYSGEQITKEDLEYMSNYYKIKK